MHRSLFFGYSEQAEKFSIHVSRELSFFLFFDSIHHLSGSELASKYGIFCIRIEASLSDWLLG